MGKFTHFVYGIKWVRLSQRTPGPAQDWLPASGSRPPVDSEKCLKIVGCTSLLLILFQSLIEVREHVCGGLEAHREPNQAFRDSYLLTFFWTETSVGSRNWPGNERLNPAKAWGADGDGGILDKAFCQFHTSLQLKTQHTAKAVEKLPCPVMLRMAGEPGIVHRFNLWSTLEKSGDLHCTGILLSHPHCQGLDAAMEKKAGVRIESSSKMVELVGDLAD